MQLGKSIPVKSINTKRTIKEITYIEKKPQTDAATSFSTTLFGPSLRVKTP